MKANSDRILYIDVVGVTIVSRGGRLYVRRQGEYTEVADMVRVIVSSGFGFVITSDAIRACVRRHIEIIVTDVAQSFTAIYAPYAPGLSSRAPLALRVRQFAAVADRQKGLRVARDIVRRKIMAEGHNKPVQTAFLADLVACTSTSACRHIEARSAQEWWQRWKDFKVNFVRGFIPSLSD